MRRFLPGMVKRGLKAVWSRVIEWLREWTKPDNHGLVGGAVADATRSKPELMLENALLRQQSDRAGPTGETPAVELARTWHHGATGQQVAKLERCLAHCAA